MVFRKLVSSTFVVCAGLTFSACTASGQEPTEHRGRKYKAPLATSHIEVTVLKGSNGKPISNAAVVFHPMKDGKDDGNLEVKTDPEGKAIIDVIATGSDLRVQVIAPGYATFGQDYKIDTENKEIAISMVRPRAQISAYENNVDQPSQRKPGVQEPIRPTKPGVPPAGSTAPVPQPAPEPAPAPATPLPQPGSVPGATLPPSL